MPAAWHSLATCIIQRTKISKGTNFNFKLASGCYGERWRKIAT